MSDLEDRLRGVDLVPSPDRWEEIQERSHHVAPPRPERRLLTALVAFAVAAAAIGGLVVAFHGPHGRPAATSLHENGVIVYVDKGPQLESITIPFTNYDLFAFDPATSARINLTNTPNVSEQSPVWSPDGSKVVFERTTATGAGPDLSIADELVVANADFSDQQMIRDCSNGCPLDIAWSPDQSTLAWAADEHLPGGGFVGALQTYDLASGNATTLCDSRSCGYAGQPAWSPDGSQIAFSDAGLNRIPGLAGPYGPIWIANVADGHVVAVTDAPRGCQQGRCVFDTSPAWSSDGASITFVRSDRGGSPTATTSIGSVNADGSDSRVLPECISNDQCRQGPLVGSPDGSAIAFVDRYDHPTLHLLDPNGDNTPILLPASVGEYPSSFKWSPDGSQLAFLGGGRQADLYLVDPARREVHDVASGLTADGEISWLPAGAIDLSSVRSPEPLPSMSPASTPIPPGEIVFQSSNGSIQEDNGVEIWRMRTDGSHLEQLTNNQTTDGDPAISPDGTRIAFESNKPGDPNTEIYVMNVDGSDQQVLTDRRTGAVQPVWSPDGTKIAFVSSAGYGEPGGIFVMTADGSDQQLVADGNASGPTWSNNGYYLAYALNTPDGETHLRLVDWTKGVVPVEPPALPGAQNQPVLSPGDGQTVAFVWSSSAGDGIYTMRLDGSDLTKIAEGENPAWSPDGTWLTYTTADDTSGPQIWAVAADGTGAHPITSLPGFVEGTQIYAITGDPSWGPVAG